MSAADGTKNILLDYYAELRAAQKLYEAESGAPGSWAGFRPSPDLPKLTDGLARLFAPARVRAASLGDYRGHSLAILDLMGNPATRTTKTAPSLLTVARAVAHVRRTGERVMIVTPTSGNKGTALRDAVLRAIQVGLVAPSELSIAVLVPQASRPKLWSSPLADDPELRRRNPVLLYPGPVPDGVKTLAREFVASEAERFLAERGVRLWYTLDLANYIVADAGRAFAEADLMKPEPGLTRVHAHAVSSAFGLLGYHLGRRARYGDPDAGHPRFLLVQHLRTPDMVLSLKRRVQPGAAAPCFAWDPGERGYVQCDDPAFPRVTDDPEEELDTTFYTRGPATSPAINEIVATHGGGGVVVSRRECQERYGLLRDWLAAVDIMLPADPGKLREWSLVMVLTGVLNAIDRDLVPDAQQVLVHASGSYSEDDYVPLPGSLVSRAGTVDDVRRIVQAAVSA